MYHSLSNALFSNVQQRVLALIFGQPDRSFYTSEIVKKLRSGTGAVERELLRLLQSGLVDVEWIGNQKHYRANRESPIFHELHGIVLKTVGLAEPLKQALEPFANSIKAAFVYGSVAKKLDTARSDIDLMIVGDALSYTDLYDNVHKAEAILGRPINLNLLTFQDWRRKLSQEDSFVARINSQPKIFVVGSEGDLQP